MSNRAANVWPKQFAHQPARLAQSHFVLLGEPNNPYRPGTPEHDQYEQVYKICRAQNAMDETADAHKAEQKVNQIMSEEPTAYGDPDAQVTEHFKRKELACPCCGDLILHPAFMAALEELRALVGAPIIVNSAYRCANHNHDVNGRPRSMHRLGRAADIRVLGLSPTELAEYAARVDAFANGGIGTYQTRGFVHVDCRGTIGQDNRHVIPDRVRWTEQ